MILAIFRRASKVNGKVALFFDEIQEVDAWEKCVNSFRIELDCDGVPGCQCGRLLHEISYHGRDALPL